MVCAQRDERQHVKSHRRPDEAGIVGYASLLARDFSAPTVVSAARSARLGVAGDAWPYLPGTRRHRIGSGRGWLCVAAGGDRVGTRAQRKKGEETGVLGVDRTSFFSGAVVDQVGQTCVHLLRWL